jgi:hypothetical protein
MSANGPIFLCIELFTYPSPMSRVARESNTASRARQDAGNRTGDPATLVQPL